MMSFFQRLFGREAAIALARGPLRLHLNAGFTLNTLAFRLPEESLLIELSGEEHTATAVSHVDLGGGSQIFRYYTSGREFLQVNTAGGSDIDDIDDVKSFVYAESYGISQKKHWQSTISPSVIRTPTLNWQGERWQRSFNKGGPGNTKPVYIPEEVENHQHAIWDVHNFITGYQRQIIDDTWEYLLLNGEELFSELGKPEWVFSQALSVNVPLTSLNVIG